MINHEVARIFSNIADLLEIKGENPFRIRAYRRASQNIEALSADLSTVPEEELTSLPGIGKDLASKIREYTETRKIRSWEELKQEVPAGLIDVISVPGLGPKTAKLLYEELRISSLEDLEHALNKGTLKGLPHIKEKTELNIRKGLELIKKGRERMPLGRALPLAETIMEFLRNNAPVREIAVAGSVRRWRETVKDIDILVTSRHPETVMDTFTGMPSVTDIVSSGRTKSSIHLSEGIQVDLRVVDESSFGAALQYFTGSKAHNVKLREIAVKKGFKINEYGIFEAKSEKRIAGNGEIDIYRTMGIPFIEPELREDTGEIEAAYDNTLPTLLDIRDIKGDLHVHSDWSDGSFPIEEIALAAKKRGYAYIALTDHSKGLTIANGLTEDRILKQIKVVDKINKKLNGFIILTGLEVDIKSDLSLDIGDDILKKLDVVVASIHSGFKQPKDKITKRLVSAMRNPYVSIIAHPTGRLIGERDAYNVDMEEVLNVAKETGTAIEINAFPARLDLNDIHSKEAKRLGVPIAISTDTHVPDHYDHMRYGVAVARRGWLEKGDVINTKGVQGLLSFLNKKRGKK